MVLCMVQLNLNFKKTHVRNMHYTNSKKFMACLRVHKKLMTSQLLAESKKFVVSLYKLVHLTRGVYSSIVQTHVNTQQRMYVPLERLPASPTYLS